MPVRNQLKAGNGGGNFPKRKLFIGDGASHSQPDHNPEPTTPRGWRRRESGGANPKVPGELMKGRAHRPHVEASSKGVPGNKMQRYHGTDEDYVRYVPLTKAYKKG